MTRAFVKRAGTGLFRAGTDEIILETEVVYGTEFRVDRVENGKAYGALLSPVPDSGYAPYPGYIEASALQNRDEALTHTVSALKAPVFKAADIKSGVTALWPLNARLRGEVTGEFIETEAGFIHARHVRKLTEPPTETDFVTMAEAHRGLPYIWGGVSTDGLDCSGLVQSSLRAVGRDAPRDSGPQSQIGEDVMADYAAGCLRRGDLVFWKGHVGIMQDKDRLLHANAFHMAVASEPLSDAVARIKKTAGDVTAIRRLN